MSCDTMRAMRTYTIVVDPEEDRAPQLMVVTIAA
jgi:hypothetical protein